MIRHFSPLFRLWHWLMAFSIFGILFTVLLRMTFLDKKEVASILMDKLGAMGVTLSSEQAIAAAKAIRAPMWDWHYIFAIFLGIAILLRIVAMLRGEAELPLLKVLRAEGLHEKGKAAIHMLLCLTIALLALSGTFYYYHDVLGFAKDSVHWVKELHEALLWPLLLLIAAHIAGVILHELTTKEAIVSRMIHGDEVK